MTSPNWAGKTFFNVLEFLYKTFGICFTGSWEANEYFKWGRNICILGKLGSSHRLQVKHTKVMCVKSVTMEESRLIWKGECVWSKLRPVRDWAERQYQRLHFCQILSSLDSWSLLSFEGANPCSKERTGFWFQKVLMGWQRVKGQTGSDYSRREYLEHPENLG